MAGMAWCYEPGLAEARCGEAGGVSYGSDGFVEASSGEAGVVWHDLVRRAKARQVPVGQARYVAARAVRHALVRFGRLGKEGLSG